MQIDKERIRPADAARSAMSRPAAINVAIYMHDLSPGGVERQCLVLARELTARGINIVLVVHQLRGELMPLLPPELRVVSLNGSRTLDDVVRLRRFLRTERPHVLLANVDHNNIAATMAKAISGTRTKVVICQHNPLSAHFTDTENWKHRLVPWFYGRMAPWVDHAIGVSDGIGGELAGAGIPQEKVTRIYNAVIGADFDCRASQPVTHPWLLDKDRPVFVSAARLVAMKDQPVLLRAFAAVVRDRPARLILLGTGPMLPDLRDLADLLGITDHVAFEGFVRNPLPYMRAADAFVLSSRCEGFGNVLVEAMGCGIPVISTDCPYGPAEILDRGRFGMLVPPRDPDAMATAMRAVLDQPGRFCPDTLRDRASAFSYAACADAYADLFRRMV